MVFKGVPFMRMNWIILFFLMIKKPMITL